MKRYISQLAKQGLTPASVRAYYAPVRAMLATADEDGLLRINPAAGVRVIVADHRPKKPRSLKADQTKALLAAMPAEHADLCYFLPPPAAVSARPWVHAGRTSDLMRKVARL